MAQPVVHFEILGRDGAALQAFYGALFGWTFSGSGQADYAVTYPGQAAADGGLTGISGGVAGISGGVTGISGGVGGVPEEYPGHVTIYVGVPDVETALARAEQLGGKRVMGPHRLPGGKQIGQFADPEGHLIGLLKTED